MRVPRAREFYFTELCVLCLYIWTARTGLFSIDFRGRACAPSSVCPCFSPSPDFITYLYVKLKSAISLHSQKWWKTTLKTSKHYRYQPIFLPLLIIILLLLFFMLRASSNFLGIFQIAVQHSQRHDLIMGFIVISKQFRNIIAHRKFWK